VGRGTALAGLLLALVAAGAGRSATPGEPMLVGFAEDLPKEIGAAAANRATELGGQAFRLTTLWSAGQAELTAGERAKLDRATAAAAGRRLVLSLYAAEGAGAPQDAAERAAYCAYVRTVLSRYDAIRDVVIWNEPNKRLFWSPQADVARLYTALLAHCYDVLHAAFPDVNVIGLALSSTGNDDAGSTSPGAFIRGVGEAYRASGRAAPLLDTVAHHPYGLEPAERPWRQHIASKVIALGDWNKLMYNLFLAFDGTAQPLPGDGAVRLWYTETGFQTTVPAGKAAAYTGSENVPAIPDRVEGEPDPPAPLETSPAPDQRTQVLDAIRLAACQPHVSAYFNFLLADEPRLEGWQSGALWADLTPKGSWQAFRDAIGEAAAGSVACDGLKGGRPSADFLPPAVPAGLQASAANDPLRVQLTWSAAADDASSVSYRVYRSGAHIATTPATAWTTTAVAPSTTYSYAVRALDAAGNLGDASPAVQVTTPAPPAPPPAEPPPSDPPAPAPAPEPSPATGGGGGGGLPPGLALTLSASPAAPRAGLPVDVLLTVANDGAAGSATGVFATIELPPGASLLGPPAHERGSGCTGATTLSCSLDFLPNGMSTALRFSVLAPVAGTIAARVRAAEWEPDLADNEASLPVDAASAAARVAPPANREPTAPGRLRAVVRQGRLALTWSASRDDTGVRTYLVFRDGVLRRSVRGRSFAERALRGRHVYTVRAVDLGGRRGAAARVVVRR
jgi:Domain of unknown function DUF11